MECGVCRGMYVVREGVCVCVGGMWGRYSFLNPKVVLGRSLHSQQEEFSLLAQVLSRRKAAPGVWSQHCRQPLHRPAPLTPPLSGP